MTLEHELDDLLLTAGEVAELAGVRASAVSNWRRRHPDFPAEIEAGRFRRRDVIEWLRNRGYVAAPSSSTLDSAQVLWAAMDLLRDAGLGEVGDELLIQLLVLRSYRHRAINPVGAELVGVWNAVTGVQATLQQIRRVVAETTSDEILVSAVMPNGRFDEAAVDWDRLLGLFALLPEKTDWIQAAASVNERSTEPWRQYASSTGQALTALMLAALEPLQGKVLDPAAGASNVLAKIAHANPAGVTHLYGQEVMERSWRLGVLSLLLQPVPFTLRVGDTLAFDRFRGLLADRVAAEPPFGVNVRSAELDDNDERWVFERPRGSGTKSEHLWVQHIVHHLAGGGLAAVAVPPSLVESGRPSDQRLVKGLIDADQVDMVIDLPPATLSGTDIRGVLLVLRRAPALRHGEILFVDLRQEGQKGRRARRSMHPTEIDRFRSMVSRWRSGDDPSEVGYCSVVRVSDVVESGYLLSPRRHINYSAAGTGRGGLAHDLKVHRNRLTRVLGRLDDLGGGFRQHVDGLLVIDSQQATSRRRLGDLLIGGITPGVRPELLGSTSAQDVRSDVTQQKFIRGDQVNGMKSEILDTDLGEALVRDSRRRAAHGDLLISRRTSPEGEVTASVVNVAAPVVFADSLLLLRPNAQVVDAHFLRIYLTSKLGAAALKAGVSGSGLMHLDRKALLDVDIDLPSLEAQQQTVLTVRAIEQWRELLQELESAVTDVEQAAKELGVSALLRSAPPANPDPPQK